MSETVAVLLSVYNGGEFLRAQIDSILAQEGIAVLLFVRDDGSTDDTPAVLAEYAARDTRFRHVVGQNVGIRDSFLSMIDICPFEADYYAFSDADDVWLPRKLAEAVRTLQAEKHDGPLLYSSQLRFVDERLRDIGYGAPLVRPLGFENAMVECRVSGATAVFNHAAREALLRYDYSAAVMHDAWIYLVVTALGKAIFDPRSFILYRQHGGNAVGGRPSAKISWQRRLDRLRGHGSSYWTQARSFLEQAAADLAPEKRVALERFVHHRDSAAARIRFAIRPTVHYQRKRSDRYFRLLVLLGRS
jgi:glycosyltransferase involved in cell wall biosynthesis